VLNTSNPEHFDVIVIGAGPAGSAAALVAARAGLKVLLLERGEYPGSKNVSGAALYGSAIMHELLPNWWEHAPVERYICRRGLAFLSPETSVSLDFRSTRYAEPPYNGFSILRPKFDRWFAQQAEEAGAFLLNAAVADDVLWKDNRVVGVRVRRDEGDILGDVVIACDGANSFIAKRAGLQREFHAHEMSLGVKEVIELDEKTIRDRFHLTGNEGMAIEYLGAITEDVHGGGFLYTNRDSLSIGTVFHLDSIVEEELESHQLLDALLTHPLLAQWLGDEYHEREYSAKLVPDSKKAALREPYRDNLVLVGDAAGQMQAQGPIIKGMNHAVTAGALAAEAFAESRARGSPEGAGGLYAKKLRDEGVMKKLRPTGYDLLGSQGEREPLAGIVDDVVDSTLGRFGVRLLGSRLERLYNSPLMVSMIPDTRTPYVTLPTVIAEELGTPVRDTSEVEPPSLEERIGNLAYNTDIGNPHIIVEDNSMAASGAAVYSCPVSARDFGGGCYREETIRTNGHEEQVVSLDTQPCVECGTCAVVADTTWTHPRGGKGVEFKEG
jgi:electron transfer flavoprotein-quinone oxidoreductase